MYIELEQRLTAPVHATHRVAQETDPMFRMYLVHTQKGHGAPELLLADDARYSTSAIGSWRESDP